MGKLQFYMAIFGVSILINVACFSLGYIKGSVAGKNSIKDQVAVATEKVIDQSLDVKGKQDEIDNAPIDAGTTNRRLHDQTY